MTKIVQLNLPKFNQVKPVKKKKLKQRKNSEKHDRLLRLFDGDGYEKFHTPKYIFVKQWNGNTQRWQVAIYTRDSWDRFQQGNEQYNHLRDIVRESD